MSAKPKLYRDVEGAWWIRIGPNCWFFDTTPDRDADPLGWPYPANFRESKRLWKLKRSR